MVNKFSELEALEADMGDETEADGMPSYLQPDKEPDYNDDLNLPAPPNRQTGAPSSRVQVQFISPLPYLSLHSVWIFNFLN